MPGTRRKNEKTAVARPSSGSLFNGGPGGGPVESPGGIREASRPRGSLLGRNAAAQTAFAADHLPAEGGLHPGAEAELPDSFDVTDSTRVMHGSISGWWLRIENRSGGPARSRPEPKRWPSIVPKKCRVSTRASSGAGVTVRGGGVRTGAGPRGAVGRRLDFAAAIGIMLDSTGPWIVRGGPDRSSIEFRPLKEVFSCPIPNRPRSVCVSPPSGDR